MSDPETSTAVTAADLMDAVAAAPEGPQVGAWFTGRNETPERTWETRSQVVAADPGRRFAWQVNNGWVHWEYAFEPEGGGTRLTERWEFLPAGIAGFHERYGVICRPL